LFSGFLLTISNPMTLVGFASVMAPLHAILDLGDSDVSAPFVLGVFIGSASWWLVLTLGVRRLRHFLSEKTLHRINLVAGIMLALFGALALCSVALRLLH
jgi:threonine/homoserine/homoserine lactone efflux protein